MEPAIYHSHKQMKYVLRSLPLLALSIAFLGASGPAVAPTPPGLLPSAAATPTLTPTPIPGASLLPDVNATPTPTPSGSLLRFSGQILDLRGGFVFFTTGDGFRLDPVYRTVDAATSGATTLRAATRTYARASFDAQSGRVVELALSRKTLPNEGSYDLVRRFAVALSTPYPNPDLIPAAAGGNAPNEHYTGRSVLVRFTVQVPPSTPFSDDVYISTDQSQWDPMAIKLIRVDALHYRIDRPYASGTKLHYRYTRGTWRSAERGEDGLEGPPRVFIVPESDTKNRTDVVYHWADENQSAPQSAPNALPTLFNPNPFVTPPHR